MFSRLAIELTVIAVSARNFTASRSFEASPLGRTARSRSVQALALSSRYQSPILPHPVASAVKFFPFLRRRSLSGGACHGSYLRLVPGSSLSLRCPEESRKTAHRWPLDTECAFCAPRPNSCRPESDCQSNAFDAASSGLVDVLLFRRAGCVLEQPHKFPEAVKVSWQGRRCAKRFLTGLKQNNNVLEGSQDL